jgi:hypothetical protein
MTRRPPVPAQQRSLFGRHSHLHRVTTAVIAGLIAAGAALAVAAPAQAIGICAPVSVPLKVMLQGPYDSTTLQMKHRLLTEGMLPALEPYSALGYRMRGGESNTTSLVDPISAATPVDWLLVELRSASDPTQIIATDTVIIGVDGNAVTPPTFAVKPGNYYVAIEHRNHLGLMTASPVAISSASALVDFSSPATPVYTVAPGVDGARFLLDGVALMHGGEVNHIVGSPANAVIADTYTALPDGDVSAVRAFVLSNGVYTDVIFPRYSLFDVNLDSVIKLTGPRNDVAEIVQYTGGNDTSVSEQLPVGVLGAASSCAPPAIATASNAKPTVGTFFTQTVTFTGEPHIVLTSTGTLPAGLSFDPVTGVISGIPTVAGAYTFTVTATNQFGSDTKDYSGIVLAVLAPTGANSNALLITGSVIVLLGFVALGISRGARRTQADRAHA